MKSPTEYEYIARTTPWHSHDLSFMCLAAQVERLGVDRFVDAYLVQTLLIQAFACEFREIFNLVVANFVVHATLHHFKKTVGRIFVTVQSFEKTALP